MSLARVHDPLSLQLVRRLGDAGGPRGDQVAAELDNLILWASSAVRCIHTDTSTVGNVGAGLDTLHTFSLPAGTLATNDDYLTIRYAGKFAANDTDKRVNASFGGTTYEGISALDIDDGTWKIEARIIRLSSTSVRVSSHMSWFALHVSSTNTVTAFSGGFLSVTRNTDITGLADLSSNAMTMAVQGEGAANNDVTQNLSIIELRQQ